MYVATVRLFVCCCCCCLAARDHVLLALFYSVLFRVHTCSKWTGTRRRRLTHDQGYDMSDGLIVHVLQVSLPVFAQYLKLLTLDKWKLQAYTLDCFTSIVTQTWKLICSIYSIQSEITSLTFQARYSILKSNIDYTQLTCTILIFMSRKLNKIEDMKWIYDKNQQ